MSFILHNVNHVLSNFDRAFSSASEKVPLIFNRLIVSFLEDLNLFNHNGISPKNKKFLREMAKESLNIKSINGDAFNITRTIEAKGLSSEVFTINDYLNKALQLCGADLSAYDKRCNDSARTRKEFSHMQRQIILICPLDKKADKLNQYKYNYTYIINPKRILDYEQLTPAQKLKILSKQIARYSAKIDFDKERENGQIYIPLKDGQEIQPWSNLKLRRTDKGVLPELTTKEKKDTSVQNQPVVSDSADLELKSKRSRKKVSKDTDSTVSGLKEHALSEKKAKKIKIDKDVFATEDSTVKKKKKLKKKLAVNDVDSTIAEDKDTKVPLKKPRKLMKKASNESDSTVKTPIKGDQLGSLEGTISKKNSKNLKKQLDDSFESISKQKLKMTAKKIKSQMNDQEDTSESETLSNVDALEQNPKKKSKVKGGVIRSENSSTKNKKKDKKKVAKKKKKEENHSDSDDEE